MRRTRHIASVAAAVLLAGCGATTPPQNSADTHTSAPAAATTYVNIPTPPGQTGPEAAPLPGTGKPPVLLGDMNTPEQFVLGALYEEALSTQGYTVDLSRNIGATDVSQGALAQGSLDAYPQYLDVFLSAVVKDPAHFRTLRAAYDTAERYAKGHGLTLLAPTPFSDTSGIAVSAPYAALHHLSSLTQLTRVEGSLTIGSPLEFTLSPQGLPALEAAYHFKPAVTTTVSLGDQYGAMRSGAIDGAYVQTSDGELASNQFVTLAGADDVYGYGNVVPVVATKVIATEGPVFVETLDRVDALLTTAAMRGLNAEMSLSQLDPEAIAPEVARDFLQAYGLVALPGWSVPPTTTTATDTTTIPTTTGTTRTATTSDAG